MAIEIADQTVESNSKEWVDIYVATDLDMQEISVPMLVVNGAGDGPTLWAQGNIHGNEQEGGLAFRDFGNDVDPEDVNGALIIVPVANPSAFKNMQRESAINEIGHNDVNRVFPGSPDGTFTNQLAHALYTTAVEHTDYMIDTHSADGDGVMNPGFSIYVKGTDVEEESRELAVASGIPHVVELPKDAIGGALYDSLNDAGVPAVILECGGNARVNDFAYQTFYTGIENVCKTVGVMEGDPVVETDPVFHGGLTFVQAHNGGFVDVHVESGDTVEEDQHLATITNIKGETVEDVAAPYDGVVMNKRINPVARPGDLIVQLVPEPGADIGTNVF